MGGREKGRKGGRELGERRRLRMEGDISQEKQFLTIVAYSGMRNDLDFETPINPNIFLRHLLTIPGLVYDLS